MIKIAFLGFFALLVSCIDYDPEIEYEGGFVWVKNAVDYNYVMLHHHLFLYPNITKLIEKENYFVFVQERDSTLFKALLRVQVEYPEVQYSDKQLDSIIKSNEQLSDQLRYKTNFWIYDKKKDELMGSYSREQFTNKLKALGIKINERN